MKRFITYVGLMLIFDYLLKVPIGYSVIGALIILELTEIKLLLEEFNKQNNE